ncbi:MAG: RHS repeat protein, partial [Proteobacteria bacterium]|nr:RHS repeat protein [Pseudomonadota bacterium]
MLPLLLIGLLVHAPASELATQHRGRLLDTTVGQQSIALTYDDAGRVASVRNGTHPATRFRYDPVDRPLRVIDPTDRVTESEWRPDDRLRIQRFGRLRVAGDDDAELDLDPTGIQELEHTYDLRGRLTEVIERRASGETLIELGWDAQDRPTTYTRAGQLISERGYDPEGRLTSLLIGGLGDEVLAELDYDESGRLEVLRVDGEERGRWSWDLADRPTRAQLDGVTACFTYHPDRSLSSLTWYLDPNLDCA